VKPPAELTGDTPQETETLLRNALAQDPENSELMLYLAQNLAGQGRVSEAATLFDRAAEDPARARQVASERRRLVESLHDQARFHLDSGDSVQARKDLEEAKVLAPEEGETFYLEGRLEEMEGNGSAALQSYRRAWEADPGDRKRREALVRLLMNGSRAAYEDEDYALAWERLEEADRVAPADADVAYVRGMVAYAWAQQTEGEASRAYFEEAERAFRQVLEEDRDDEDTRFNLGAVLMALGRPQEAARIYEDLIREDRLDGRLYLALARAHGLGGADSTAVTYEAVGRGLRTEDPVEDPAGWGRRAAERFPGAPLERTYREQGAPQAVYTYTLPDGDLVEVWLYWRRGVAEAFREGEPIGSPVVLPR
jgi:tetratricopeptide (TPR) repeat protein